MENKYIIPMTLDLEAAIADLHIPAYFEDCWDEEDDWDILVVQGLNSVFVTVCDRLADTPRIIAMDADGEVYVSSGGACDGTLGATLDLDGKCWYQGDEVIRVATNFPLPKHTHWYQMVGLCVSTRFCVTSEKAKKMLAEKMKIAFAK